MKKIKLIIIGIFVLILMPKSVFASSGSISVTASSTNVKVGDTVKVTVTFKANNGIGGYLMTLKPSSSVLSVKDSLTLDGLVSGTPTVNYNYVTFTAINTGSCTFTVSPISNGEFVDVDGDAVDYSFSSVTINVSEATYEDIKKRSSSNNNSTKKIEADKENLSNNNFLKSLLIEGIELSPSFDKEHLEYSAVLKKLVDTVNIVAEKEDDSATIVGDGVVNVSSGENKLEIKVIAENGDEKVYIIHLNIEDSDAINVKINNKKYTVVKNKELLKCPLGFTETTIKINDVEVPAFKKNNIILVGLKDSKGKIYLYEYNKGKYTKFLNLSNSKLNLYILDYNKVPTGFKKSTIKIGSDKYPVFISKNNKNIILVYAINLNNGKKGLFQYDKVNKSFISYDSSIEKSINNYKIITIISVCIASLLLIINLFNSIKKMKKKKEKV